MIKRKLFLVFGLIFVLSGAKNLKAQSTGAIVLNEYCLTNVPIGSFNDNFGQGSSYVEIYNNHTSPVNLGTYYLSNDENNLFKWKFPNNFTIGVGEYKLVWLSGRNLSNDINNVHANFTIEQCRNQSLILSTSTGVIRDKILIQPTMAGHVRGRVDYDNMGVDAWRVFKTKSPLAHNGTPDGLGYAPTPKAYVSDVTTFTDAENKGGFYDGGAQILYFKLNNETYDSTFSCYDIFYTLNGDYPVPGYPPVPPTVRYADSANGNFTISDTKMLRAIAVQQPVTQDCPNNNLPSFCETNTYFIDPDHQLFHEDFGVISLALDRADINWFNSNGTPPATVHVEYYDKEKQVSEGYGMMSRPPQEAWITKQRGFYVTKDDRLGFGCNFEGNIFNVDLLGTTPRQVFPTLHVKAGDYESHSVPGFTTGISWGTGIRDVLIQSIAAKNNLHVSPLHIKPIITFINGKYLGVYDLREVYDKYYENYYNGQPKEELDLNFVHKCEEGIVQYWDGTSSSYGSDFVSKVYKPVTSRPMKGGADYNGVMANLDKESFIDYMILNSYAVNSNIWCNNLALARGSQTNKPGGKWHYYLWNMPSIFSFTTLSTNTLNIGSDGQSPCFMHGITLPVYDTTRNAWNGAGNILKYLMNPTNGNGAFQLQYKNRYQDLMNGPLKCDNIVKHHDAIVKLYEKEMKYHEDPGSASNGSFVTTPDMWSINDTALRKAIQKRCDFVANAFDTKDCFGAAGPFDISVNVKPEGAGLVKLNSILLDSFTWYGKYYQTTMSFKAIPTSTAFIFHHWEFDGPTPTVPLSLDSVSVNFNKSGSATAIFTDRRSDIANTGEYMNVPTAFTPNGDDLNETFKPLGSAEYATEYQMTIWNRWGQEIFRTIDPLVGWDGKYKGQDAQTGVYAYFITYKNVYNEAKLVKGNVTLTR